MNYELFLSIASLFSSNVLLWFWFLIAIYVWCSSRERLWSRIVGLSLIIFIWFLGTSPLANAVLWPLENSYQPPKINLLKDQGLREIVVLTGGGYSGRGEVLSSAFPHASVYRFVGGLELCAYLGPNCRVIFSGSAGRQRRDLATAETMRDLSLLLNPGREVLAEAQSGSTAEHPSNVRPILQNEPFLLVTSAVHMRRSMRTFEKAGLKPIAYPVDVLATSGPYGWGSWIPSVENLWKINVALREYLALTFYTLKGW